MGGGFYFMSAGAQRRGLVNQLRQLSTAGVKIFLKIILEKLRALDDKASEVSTLFEQNNFPALFVIRYMP